MREPLQLTSRRKGMSTHRLAASLLTACAVLTSCGTATSSIRAPDVTADPMQRQITLFQTGSQSLVASFVGAPPGPPPCGSRPRLDIVETAEGVRVTVDDPVARQGAAEGGNCPTVGYTWNLLAELRAPLAGRPIVGPDGTLQSVTQVPVLANVPPGYALESIDPTIPVRVTYRRADGAGVVLAKHDPSSNPFEAYELVQSFEVAGGVGHLYDLGADLVVTWTEEFRISITALAISGQESIDRDDLVRLAQEQSTTA